MQKVCATCEYFSGERRYGLSGPVVNEKKKGYCSGNGPLMGTDVSPYNTCFHWKIWAAMKR